MEMIQPGNLLVASRESSESNLELVDKHPEVAKDILHWTKTCFLILTATKGVVAGEWCSSQRPRHALFLFTLRGKVQCFLDVTSLGSIYCDKQLTASICGMPVSMR